MTKGCFLCTAISSGLALLLAPALASAQLIEPRYQQTRELIALVKEAAELIGSEGVETACNQFRVEGSRWYHDDTYVFVLDTEGEAICHPARPSLEGRRLIELRDPKGKTIVANFVRELESADQGWVHYQWPRPDGQVFYWKTSHVRRAKDRHGKALIVGSGRYQMKMEPFFVVEQVDDAIELIRQEGAEKAFETLRDESSGFLFYNAYVFVLNSSGVLLVNNAFPENEGKDVSDLADIDGKAFVREMLAVPPGGSAWVNYKWPKPGDTRPSAKSSFVRSVEINGKQLVVGSGVYFGTEPEVRELGPKSDVP